MNSAPNRERDVQRVSRVAHPENKAESRASGRKLRQIRPAVVGLHDIAAYASAHEVSQNMTGRLESLPIRRFANDLLDVRMERSGGGPQGGKRVEKAK